MSAPQQQLPALIMPRFPDWPERLAAYLRHMQDTPFAWGRFDCASFCAEAVATQTGHFVRMPTWANRRQALAALRQAGGLVQAVDAVLPRLGHPLTAQRGDVVLVRGPAYHFLGINTGFTWAAPGRHGLAFGPLQQVTEAWAVGRATGCPYQEHTHG